MIHSFLMIGQSNMAGRGEIGDVAPISNPSLRVLRNGRWQRLFVPVNPDRPFSGICLAESFADAYQREHGVDVGLIPCADGGTRLEQWKEGSLLFDHAVFQTRLAERTSTLAGVLWHQGEGDCAEGRFETYRERLDVFYEALHRALNLTDVPFLVGGLGDFLKDFASLKDHFRDVDRQLQQFAAARPMTGYVSASGLKGKPDNLHFSAEGLREFGLRYYQVFRTLEKKDRVFADKPREDDALRTELDGM